MFLFRCARARDIQCMCLFYWLLRNDTVVQIVRSQNDGIYIMLLLAMPRWMLAHLCNKQMGKQIFNMGWFGGKSCVHCIVSYFSISFIIFGTLDDDLLGKCVDKTRLFWEGNLPLAWEDHLYCVNISVLFFLLLYAARLCAFKGYWEGYFCTEWERFFVTLSYHWSLYNEN